VQEKKKKKKNLVVEDLGSSWGLGKMGHRSEEVNFDEA